MMCDKINDADRMCDYAVMGFSPLQVHPLKKRVQQPPVRIVELSFNLCSI